MDFLCRVKLNVAAVALSLFLLAAFMKLIPELVMIG
jgi:hypothetical protein